MVTLIDDVTALSNQDLLSYSKQLVQHENIVGLHIIVCLREAERRMLYLEMNMSSLWAYATQYLGLSEGNAQLKISAMRLARDNKIAQAKIESGELSITNASKISSFFRQEKKAGHTYTSEQKADVIQSVVGLSQSQCERALLALAPETILEEKVRPLTDTKTEIKIVVDNETLAVLERLKELLSHKMPNATYAELLDVLAREKVAAIEKKQMRKGAQIEAAEAVHVVPVEKKIEVTATTAVDLPTKVDHASTFISTPTPRKYISVVDRRWTMRKAEGQCEYISPDGDRCTSRWKLQLDHVKLLAHGGKNERNNYRMLCAQHNLYHAFVMLGPVMRKYVPSLT